MNSPRLPCSWPTVHTQLMSLSTMLPTSIFTTVSCSDSCKQLPASGTEPLLQQQPSLDKLAPRGVPSACVP